MGGGGDRVFFFFFFGGGGGGWKGGKEGRDLTRYLIRTTCPRLHTNFV